MARLKGLEPNRTLRVGTSELPPELNLLPHVTPDRSRSHKQFRQLAWSTRVPDPNETTRKHLYPIDIDAVNTHQDYYEQSVLLPSTLGHFFLNGVIRRILISEFHVGVFVGGVLRLIDLSAYFHQISTHGWMVDNVMGFKSYWYPGKTDRFERSVPPPPWVTRNPAPTKEAWRPLVDEPIRGLWSDIPTELTYTLYWENLADPVE